MNYGLLATRKNIAFIGNGFWHGWGDEDEDEDMGVVCQVEQVDEFEHRTVEMFRVFDYY